MNTIGFHLVKSAYGPWLPGDDRGSWSDAWDEQIGYYEPHTLHPGDPVRLRMAQERMKHAPVRFGAEMIDAIAWSVGDCVKRSKGGLAVAAATTQPTHMHLLIPYNPRDIDNTVKWIADQTTKAVHGRTSHAGPVWCDGKWRTYIFDPVYWQQAGEYIRRHNVRAGLAADPFEFVTSG